MTQQHPNSLDLSDGDMLDHDTINDFQPMSDDFLRLQAGEILDKVTSAFLVLDSHWRIIYANREACRINQKELQEFVGRTHWDEWPASVGTEVEQQYRRAMQDRVDVHFEHRYLSEGYDVWLHIDAYPTGQTLGVFYHDITRQKRADEALRRSDERYRQLLETTQEGVATVDQNDRITYVNPRMCQLVGYTQDELRQMGLVELLFPEDRDVASQRRRQRKPGSQEQYEMRLRRKDGGAVWVINSINVLENNGENAGTFSMLTDITERRHAEEALRRSQEDLYLAIDAAHLGTFFCDWPLDKIQWNNICKDHFFLPHDAEVDFNLFYSLLHPDDRERTRAAIEKAFAERVEYNIEYRTMAADGRTRWVNAVGRFYFNSEGNPFRFDGITIDISQRKRAEQELVERAEREGLLNKIGQAIRSTLDPDEIQNTAVAELGKAMDVDRCYFSLYDVDSDLIWIGEDFRRNDLPSLSGRYSISSFEVDVNDYYPGGEAMVVADALDPFWAFPKPLVDAIRQLRVRSAISVPLYEGKRLVATLAVAMADAARGWRDEDVRLVEAVAAQTRSAVETARLLAERQERLESEALIGRIGAAIRNTLDAESIKEAAAAALGSALHTDRCYFITYDVPSETIEAGRDWCRSDLPTLAGRYDYRDFEPFLSELFVGEATRAISDVTTSSLSAASVTMLESFGMRALVAVPLYEEGTLAAALTVGMADTARSWTMYEMALVEQVATLVRTVLESARITRKEHAIAQQLQAALQPTIPAHVPGMRLADYYRPALEEAGVGGDFSDVFSFGTSVTYLVVGDLSGKGLAAASQVATVRNMLRFSLYNGESLASAVTQLNRTLVTHNLLSGFATLFIGRFDQTDNTLVYVNCGQDAGLVLHGSRPDITTLAPTGPVLGGFDVVDYDEASITLNSGDVVALFTDGLTEAGPSRTTLLSGDGVAEILRGLHGVQDPCSIVGQLVGGVDAYARGGIQDDQCLIVGVVADGA